MHGTIGIPPERRRPPEWPPHVQAALYDWFRRMLQLAYSEEGIAMGADKFRATYKHE